MLAIIELQNNLPVRVTVAGALLTLVVGTIVWRLSPSSTQSTSVTLDYFGRRFWREVATTYGFAIAMFVMAIVPGLDFTYSGHGGLSWLIAPLCFPYIVTRLLYRVGVGSVQSRVWFKCFCKVTLPSYIVLALPLSWCAAASIRNYVGLELSMWWFYATMISPVPWFYFT